MSPSTSNPPTWAITPNLAKPLYKAALGLLLVAGTIALYSPVRAYEFITYDDYDYVLNNTNVNAGLKWQTVQWSLTTTELANWHPVTWLSHALDCQLFGLEPGYHHLTNVLIHAINVLLLFVLLQLATGAVGRSFVVAALFAWHPLNVQSVAWVAERKNLLCMLFFLLGLGAYGWYARKPQLRRFLMVVVIFVLALASKPMAVSFPLVVLLLDFWPLQRVKGWMNISPRLSIPQQSIGRLVLEKLPLFVLSVASSVVTLWAQRAGGALESLRELSLGVRLENSLYSYLLYICKTLWLSGYAVFYPHPGPALALWKPAVAVVFLCAVSVAVWRQRATRSYLIFGWLWYVVTMLPMIGVVQVGDQAMADRYGYLPLIGIFVIAIWGTADFFNSRRLGTVPRFGTVILALGAVALVSYLQLGYWKNTETVWSHALTVARGDPRVEMKLGHALVLLSQPGAALPHLVIARNFDPADALVRVDLGMCLLAQGRTQEAIPEFEAAVSIIDPSSLVPGAREFRASAFIDLGIAYTIEKQYSKALTSFQNARQTDLSSVDDSMQKIGQALGSSPSEIDYLTFALMLRSKGENNQASSILQRAIQENPDYTDVRQLLKGGDTGPR